VFIKVDGTSFTEMFTANDWKPFQSCSPQINKNPAKKLLLQHEKLHVWLKKHQKEKI
jgi:hypothetical protein